MTAAWDETVVVISKVGTHTFHWSSFLRNSFILFQRKLPSFSSTLLLQLIAAGEQNITRWSRKVKQINRIVHKGPWPGREALLVHRSWSISLEIFERNLSRKSDVYNYGILLLQMVNAGLNVEIIKSFQMIKWGLFSWKGLTSTY